MARDAGAECHIRASMILVHHEDQGALHVLLPEPHCRPRVAEPPPKGEVDVAGVVLWNIDAEGDVAVI